MKYKVILMVDTDTTDTNTFIDEMWECLDSLPCNDIDIQETEQINDN